MSISRMQCVRPELLESRPASRVSTRSRRASTFGPVRSGMSAESSGEWGHVHLAQCLEDGLRNGIVIGSMPVTRAIDLRQ